MICSARFCEDSSLKIDREHVRNTFQNYTDAYDAKDPKIALKIAHTYRVAGMCDTIAHSAKAMTTEDIDIAWLSGMLHDVGRFEQIRRYGTFSDADSVDHATLGADLLFGGPLAEEGQLGPSVHGPGQMIRDYIADNSEDKLLETAVRQHSLYRIDSNLDERTKMFCTFLRDADKIDIYRVNVETPMTDIYNCTEEELMTCDITPEVMQCVMEHHTVLRSLKKTPLDNLVGHMCLAFELVWPVSYDLLKRQGWLDEMIGIGMRTRNDAARYKMVRAAREVEVFIDSKVEEKNA